MTLSPIVPVWLVRTEVDYVQDAAEELQGSAVYVDQSADLSSASAIEGVASQQDVAVVALPEDATQTFSASGLAAQLLRATDDYETVIVVIDGPRDSYGTAGDDATALLTALNSAGESEGGAAVLQTLESDSWRTSTSGGSGSGGDDGGSGFGTVVGVGGGLVGLAVVAAAGALVVRRLRQGGTATTARDVPEELRHVLARLDSLQTLHGSEFDPAAAQRLTSIRANVRELFRRIRRTGTEQQVRIASIEYIDVLTKLERALGPDYYLDLIRSPRLWENAAARRAEVEEAVAATDDQLVTNIRQVNASQDLEFKVALESLVGSMNATVKDIYSDPTDPQGDKPS
ncbi:hypothetical protein [Nocardioides cavernaquae]|uniref:Uncharacterized protein n=1 Tax=Nocardioides cavernaquae TaxID=2321396 RepID=A0A3A5H8J7_9ACTN|nr:hypothetical protein [Nocardioides cavernaquae]RJS46943.1 hypothetical protein D4739_12440 [Nocardioides cavernaquae]